MDNLPQISCIMAVYNTEEKYLRAAIESVLHQSFKDFEFIIIDDCSGDAQTLSILDSYTDTRIIRIRNEQNIGLTASLNKGIKIAKGKYIARMDADDVCHLRRFEKQYYYMEKKAEVAVLGTRAKRIGEETGNLGITSNNLDAIKARLFFGNDGIIIHPSVFMRRDFLEKYSLLYDENIKKAQDYDFWVRIIKHGKIEILPQYLLYYRVHSAQISHLTSSVQRNYADIIRLRQVEELVGVLSEDEGKIHLAICMGRVFAEHEQTAYWVAKLINANRKKRLICPFYFENTLMTLFAIASLKYIHQKKVVPIVWRLLNPYYYYGYFSFIINKKIRQRRVEKIF